MKRRLRQTAESEVNLLPMMDVLLCLLAFFVLVSIHLKPAQPNLKIQLPEIMDGPTAKTNGLDIQPLGLQPTATGQLQEGETPLCENDLEFRPQQYFQTTSNGTVLLVADQSHPFTCS